MSRILVAAYSRTGNTRKAGEAIASALQADFEMITDDKPRKGFIQYMKSAHEAIRGKNAPIMPTTRDPGFYDLVILGTPVWASHMASPFRTYVNNNLEKLEKWAIFCTEGGSGHDKVFLEVTELIGSNPVARVDIKQREVKSKTFDSKVQTFVSTIFQQLDSGS